MLNSANARSGFTMRTFTARNCASIALRIWPNSIGVMSDLFSKPRAISDGDPARDINSATNSVAAFVYGGAGDCASCALADKKEKEIRKMKMIRDRNGDDI